MPFPSKINDNHCSKLSGPVTLDLDIAEKKCLSMSTTNQKGRFFD